jgi:hypothetical protein
MCDHEDKVTTARKASSIEQEGPWRAPGKTQVPRYGNIAVFLRLDRDKLITNSYKHDTYADQWLNVDVRGSSL